MTDGRLPEILRRRGPLSYLAVLALLSVVAAFAPLSDHLGYELAELVALIAGLLGAAPGVAAARVELARAAGGNRASGLSALGAALAVAGLALLLPLALILLNGLRRPACDPAAGLVLYLALAVPSGLLSAALGAACGFLWPRRAGILVALVFTATLAAALSPLLRGPQVFAYHHLGGMYPGPIYDEAISASPALWAFRAATVLYAAFCGGVALAAATARLGESRRVLLAGLSLALCGGVPALLLSLRAEALHWKASATELSAELGGRIETEHLVLHVPREKAEAERKLLALDAETSFREVRQFYGLRDAPAPPKIEAWFYRSPAEKQRLIGAADTSFTKPWLRQIHTNDAPAPHPILRHELAHALAADFASGPLRVPGRLGGLLPDMAFIEGLAVAADWPAGEATVHEETAAMRALGKAPEMAALFRPGRFYAESGPRAYTAAGSFLRFLWQEKGAEALRRAYGSRQGIAELGPLRELSAQHLRFLDGVAVREHVRALAALRFSAKPIVHKTCAHEVAELARGASLAAERGDMEGAARLWRQCAQLEPDDPALLLSLRRALSAAHQDLAAEHVAQRALAHMKLSLPLQAQLFTELGDEAWKRGDVDEASARYAQAARLPQPEPGERALIARRYALAEPSRWPAARKLLAEGEAGPETLLALRELQLSRPREGFAAYLLAKQLQNRRAWQECARYAQAALERELPSPLFAQEALRMRGIAAWHLRDAAAARAAFARLGKDAPPGRALEAAQWLARVDAL
jgi:hypothetical protein